MTKDYNKLISSNITIDRARDLAAAIVKQAFEDYKNYPEERATIEKWLLTGDVWLDILDLDPLYLLEVFKKHGKSKENKTGTKTV